MKPTMEILARINQDSRRNKEEIFTRLYRYLLRPDIYYVAYQNLYANKGAGTKGTDNDTADGFSEKKIAEAGIERRFINDDLERCFAEIMTYLGEIL